MEAPHPILRSAGTLALFLSCMTFGGFAQDSLRIIELSGPGQSAPVNVPAGHAFTFSLFTPESSRNDPDAAVGVVTYAAPVSYTYERKYQAPVGIQVEREGWLLGPAAVELRGNGNGARMHLYTMKLPPGVVSGILSENAPIFSVEIPKGSMLTSYLGFAASNPRFYNAWTALEAPPFSHYVSVISQKGIVYGYSELSVVNVGHWRIGTPRLRGSSSLHNPDAPASSVVRGFYYDDLETVSPTSDFVGRGLATFSLPPEDDKSTPIAFYCYRITPANIIGADATPPVVKVTAPKTASASTGASSFVLKGSVTDNINATNIRFRVRAPNSSVYSNWTSVNLGGDAKTKSWQRAIGLARKGVWRVQVQALDGEQNASTVQTVALTKQ